MYVLKNYNRNRVFDGHNCDLGLQITYVAKKKKKIKHIKCSDSIVIENLTLMANCNSFYSERINNYKQMLSDFTFFNEKNINTLYLTPLIIKKGEDVVFCHVKVDEIYDYRFLKFNFVTLINDICFFDYVGDIDYFISNEIKSSNGYDFYINNKKIKFVSLKSAIEYYLKKSRMVDYQYSIDNVVVLTDEFEKVMEKYLGRSHLTGNLYVNNKKQNFFPSLYGVYLSNRGNFIYVFQGSDSLCEEYNALVPAFENSYDILKQYMLLNEFLLFKYKDYCTYSVKTKNLKIDYKEICFFKNFRDNLLNNSEKSVSNIVKEFEKNCPNKIFIKKANSLKKYIVNEFKARKISGTDFLSDVISKTAGEVYDKSIDKFN